MKHKTTSLFSHRSVINPAVHNTEITELEIAQIGVKTADLFPLLAQKLFLINSYIYSIYPSPPPIWPGVCIAPNQPATLVQRNFLAMLLTGVLSSRRSHQSLPPFSIIPNNNCSYALISTLKRVDNKSQLNSMDLSLSTHLNSMDLSL